MLDQLVAFEGLTIQTRSLENQQHGRVPILENQQHAVQTFSRAGATITARGVTNTLHFWLGPDAELLYVNNTACKSLGYTREELLSMTVFDIDPAVATGVFITTSNDILGVLVYFFIASSYLRGI